MMDQRRSQRLSLEDLLTPHEVVEPVDALAPLVTGGVIVTTTGYQTLQHRPPSTVKSLPAYPPFRRRARHRSFLLWWINEFRHWWKSSRLLVRLGGLWTLAIAIDFLAKMQSIEPYRKHHKANAKNTHKALKIVKHLGRGGVMAWFLNAVQPFTRTIRLLVAGWRWIEAAQCRRLEVGVEESMVRVECMFVLNIYIPIMIFFITYEAIDVHFDDSSQALCRYAVFYCYTRPLSAIVCHVLCHAVLLT